MIAQCLKTADDTVPIASNDIESFKLARFTVFRAALIHKLIRRVATRFADRVVEDKLLGGPPLVDEIADANDALERLKKFATTHIYKTRAVHDKELTGGVIISGILDAFRPLLLYKREDFLNVVKGEKTENAHTVGPALCSLLPTKGKAMYRHFVDVKKADRSISDVEEWMLRAHLILDYVAGMTDRYALSVYRQLSSP
jgi:dGTPase